MDFEGYEPYDMDISYALNIELTPSWKVVVDPDAGFWSEDGFWTFGLVEVGLMKLGLVKLGSNWFLSCLCFNKSEKLSINSKTNLNK